MAWSRPQRSRPAGVSWRRPRAPAHRPPRLPPRTRAPAGPGVPRQGFDDHRPAIRAAYSWGPLVQWDAYLDGCPQPCGRHDGKLRLNETGPLFHARKAEPRLGVHGCGIETHAPVLDA